MKKGKKSLGIKNVDGQFNENNSYWETNLSMCLSLIKLKSCFQY